MTNKELVEDIIKTIKEEMGLSTSTKYHCKDGTNINTDVGYVYDWFVSNEKLGYVGYEDVLRKRYEN